MCLVSRLHRLAEASLGWLGASVLSIALLDTGFVQSARHSCVETTSVSTCTWNHVMPRLLYTRFMLVRGVYICERA